MSEKNKRPIQYLQKDPAWAKIKYCVSGEDTDIGRAGCGPTCAAMVLSTYLNQPITPADTCKWALAHGYKAKGQGTYYSYFPAQFHSYGITCRRINSASLYHRPTAPEHQEMLCALRRGHLVIACMGPGLWTRSGHFILLWDADSKLYINDPASRRPERENGAPSIFYNEVKYYWVAERPLTAEGNPTMTFAKAKELIQKKAGLSDETMAFLACYKYANDLLIKLANAMQ